MKQQGSGLAGAVRAVSVVTFVSRLMGLIRDVLLVQLFGATALGSAFTAAFAIPNMFRRLFGEGALSAAFIPEYARARRDDPDRLAPALASATLGMLLAVTGAIAALVIGSLLGLMAIFDLTPEQRLSYGLIAAMIPFMPLVCCAAILAGMLQVHGRFGVSSAGPIVLNVFVILTAGTLLARGQAATGDTAYLLAAATVASGFTQIAWFWSMLRRSTRLTLDVAPARDATRKMLIRFGPVVIGLGTLQLNTLGDTFIAMYPVWIGPTIAGVAYPLNEASNIVLASATRLYQFPLGVFGIAVATAVFPLLARQSDDGEAFLSTLRRGIRLSLFIALPAAAGLALVREPLVALLFAGPADGSSGFDSDALARSAACVLGFAPGIWAYSLNHVFTRAFYAKGDTTTPMRIAIAMVASNLALNLLLIWPLGESGLAWATTTTAILQCALLAIACRRRLGTHVFDTHTLRAIARLLLATAVMIAAIILAAPLWARLAEAAGDGRAGAAAATCAIVATGITVYAIAGALCRVREWRWLLERRTPEA